MKKIIKNDFIVLLLIFIGFILIRSFHFVDFLNWSQDQAECGMAALDIWRNKKLTLIGPQISATFEGRLLFQGPITYYLFLIFLLAGSWDPVKASYLFMLFASFLIFPLFYGVKKLTNKKVAYLTVLIYSFIPYYINYTRFLWNSTLQLTFSILFIYFFSFYQKSKNLKYFFISSFFLGLLFQFHYQFILVILSFFIYFLFLKKISIKEWLIFIVGIILGFSPLIIFELKHQFYNTKTAILFLKNWSMVDKPGNFTMPHYYLTLSFLFLIFSSYKFKNLINEIKWKFIIILGIILFFTGLFKNIKKPNQSYWAPAKGWQYSMEEKAYQIIKKQPIKKNFNVADLSYYNTKAAVIKYFLKRDNFSINFDDYYQNRYLYVISKNNEYENALSYEVAFFKPRKLIKKWHLQNDFYLYLFERI
jgi:hypothetical protein